MAGRKGCKESVSGISRRGVLTVLGSAAGLVVGGGLLLNQSNNVNQKVSPGEDGGENDAPKLDIERANEMHYQLWDAVLGRVDGAPVFTGTQPLVLPPPASIARTSRNYGFMTGSARLQHAGRPDILAVNSWMKSISDDDLQVEAGVCVSVQQSDVTTAEVDAIWDAPRDAIVTERDFLKYIKRYPPHVAALSFMPGSEYPSRGSSGSDRPLEIYTMSPGVEGFTIVHRGGSQLRQLSPTGEVLDDISQAFVCVQERFRQAGFP